MRLLLKFQQIFIKIRIVNKIRKLLSLEVRNDKIGFLIIVIWLSFKLFFVNYLYLFTIRIIEVLYYWK